MFRLHHHDRPEPGPQLTPWGFYAVRPEKPARDPFRMVALGIVLTLVLVVGGCLVTVGAMAQQFRTAFEVDPAPVTSATSMPVETGMPFVLSGFRAASGWALAETSLGGSTIAGLRVTNVGVRAVNLRYAFTFRLDGRWVTEVDCFCPSVEPGETVPMRCLPTAARLPLEYDRVVVADSY